MDWLTILLVIAATASLVFDVIATRWHLQDRKHGHKIADHHTIQIAEKVADRLMLVHNGEGEEKNE